MINVQWNQGIRLPELGLSLDPFLSAPFAFVSHAHSDHAGNHTETILTESTARLMEARMGALHGKLHCLPFEQPTTFLKFAATLLPAGHVLGSAQIFLQSDQGTLLYTGDFKLRAGQSSEPAGFCHAETLVMETTYGLPKYEFPPTESVLSDVVAFCRATLEDGETPVLLGYSLGKAQEVLVALAGAGLSIALDEPVWKISELYRGMGISFPSYERWKKQPTEGKVIICAPGSVRSGRMKRMARKRVAMLSGWAIEPGAIHRYGCDAAFPLSDHADYPDLLRHVEQVAPQKILTLHGFAREFASDLRERGWEAWALNGPNQLDLGLPPASPTVVVANVPTPEACAAQLERSGFGRFCLMVDKIGRTPGRLAKTRLLADFFRKLSEPDLARCAVWFTGRLFPRSEETPLGIGSAVVRRALLEVTSLSEPALRAVARQFNDSGKTTFHLLAGRSSLQRMEIHELQAIFTKLRDIRSSLGKIELLSNLLGRISALEAMVVVKLLSGDLRIGLKEGLVEDAIAEAFQIEGARVRQAGMLLGDIGRVAVLTRQNRLEGVEMSLFRPVACMLAGTEPDATSVWQRFVALPSFRNQLWVESKLDGIRTQLHCDGKRAELFSRDLRKISSSFPEIVQEAEAGQRPWILDGELLAMEGGKLLGFAALQRRLGRQDGDLFLQEEIPVRFVAFDLLWLDGATLLGRPLRERRQLLQELRFANSIRLGEVRMVENAEELETAFKEARSCGHEGLVVKDPESPYTPGRRGLSWIKWKGGGQTLDVVVVAVEYGHGKRAGLLSDYTFAVQGPDGQLLTIGKAYTGLRDVEIESLTGRFQQLALRQKGNRIEVRAEVVLEVAFDSIRQSSRHPSGLALRFPRIRRLRQDKTPSEIDTLEQARSLLHH